MAAATTQPHVMVLPFPAQGHVIPLMELSHKLTEGGLQIDFVNTEFNHGRVIKALAEKGTKIPDGIHMVSIPDGLGPADDHTDLTKLVSGLRAAMFVRLEEMIRSKKIEWMIADVSMSWALELATTVGVRVALFSPYSAAVFALKMKLPELIDNGVIDEDGNTKRHERIEMVPPIEAAEIPWISPGTPPDRRRVNIQSVIKTNRLVPLAEVILCNTSMALEPEALALLPNALPLGPLTSPASSPAGGHFLPEDTACLAWLDAQAAGSVVYVAFGSTGVLDAAQFQELAGGLALSGRPFLWVVWPELTAGIGEDWFDAFKRGVEGRGLVVGWAPQRRVLSHPSVACFVSHCGWNSTMDGAMHGVPFLCWPYFADQFLNRSYVCSVWKTGVKLCRDDRGIVTKEEIENKVAQLLGDAEIKARAAALKDANSACVREGGSSHKNWVKLLNLLTKY